MMSRSGISQVSALVAVALCVWPAMRRSVRGSEQQPIRIHVANRPRPVAEAVMQVEAATGVVVTYEDTRYVHPDDIVDITDRLAPDKHLSERIVAMRPGTIDVTYDPQPGPIEPQVDGLLHRVLADSDAMGNTGRFRVEKVTGGYHVVPVAMRGTSGAMEPYASPLDTPFTLPHQEGNAFEMISLLTQTVTTASGHRVGPGLIPMNWSARSRLTVEAHHERARDVLWRALRSANLDLSWQLRCEVGDDGLCALNIHGVQEKQ